MKENKDFIYDNNLSLKSKGLLILLKDFNIENKNINIMELLKYCKESQTALNSAIVELKALGYLKVKKLNPNQSSNGRYEYIYELNL